MYRIINDNIGLILENMKENHLIPDYISLLTRLHEGNITKNQVFIDDYKKFWAMNVARLPQEFFNRYFDYLEKNKKNQQITLLDVIEYLYHNSTKNRKVHFSFSSKLVHMINPNKPIYDTNIQSFYYLPDFSIEESYDDKIAVINKNYDFIEYEYKRIIRDNLLDPSINLFYKFEPNQDEITYVKIIDSLIWTLVKLLRKGYVRDREIIYK